MACIQCTATAKPAAGSCLNPPHFVTDATACWDALPSASALGSRVSQLQAVPVNISLALHPTCLSVTPSVQPPIDPILINSNIDPIILAASVLDAPVDPIPTSSATAAVFPCAISPNVAASQAINAMPNPWYTSQMSAVFTDQWEMEQDLQ